MTPFERDARDMLQRWTNRTTGIANMGFICRGDTLTDEWGATIDELRGKVSLSSPGAPRPSVGVKTVTIMGRSEHNGSPVMRLEAWDPATGESIALIQPFRRGLFGNYPRPTGKAIHAGSPPRPPRRASRLP